ncbi:molybdenum cofactor guanylyltransferase MobA [Acetobacter indonesiensis]
MIFHSPSARTGAVILAGGQGLRMGGCDKPLLSIADVPVLTRLIDRLQPQCQALAISANGNPDRFSAWGLPVLPDTMPDCGPLAGVLAALAWGQSHNLETVLTVPGDTPFIPANLMADLLPAPAVAVSDGRQHPLVATWPVSALQALQDWLNQPDFPDKLRVRVFARTLGIREVTFAAESYDPFFNINTPDEYATACTLADKEQANDR